MLSKIHTENVLFILISFYQLTQERAVLCSFGDLFAVWVSSQGNNILTQYFSVKAIINLFSKYACLKT